MWGGSHEEGVDASPIAINALAGVPLEAIGVGKTCDASGHRREHAGTAHLFGKQACNRKVQVAYDFGFHPEAVLAMYKFVVGVKFGEFRSMDG